MLIKVYYLVTISNKILIQYIKLIRFHKQLKKIKQNEYYLWFSNILNDMTLKSIKSINLDNLRVIVRK